MQCSGFAWILGSIVFSTSIIVVNKKLMNELGFHSPMFLTSYHFFMTYILLEIMCSVGWVKRAENFPLKERWFIGSMGIAAVVLQNMNLMYNSVGFYQLTKLACIPFMVAYSYLVDHQVTPMNIIFSLAWLLVGLVLFSVNDVSINLFGTIVAATVIPVGSINTLLLKNKQNQYGINGPSLQHATAFQSGVVCLFCACCAETYGKNSIFTCNWSTKTILTALSTGLLAVGVNVCALGLIGKTNAITFMVVGHVKTMLIFIFGLLLFPDKRETLDQQKKKIIGLIIAMVGAVLYSVFEMRNKNKKDEAKLKVESDNDDDELMKNENSADNFEEAGDIDDVEIEENKV